MRRTRNLTIAGILAAGAGLAGGCNQCGDAECKFATAEWEVVKTLSPLPDPPADPSNRFENDPAAATLGKKLFWEKRYSTALRVASTLGNVGDMQRVNCVVCHDPESGFSDTRSNPNNLSVAVSWTSRNTIALVNAVYYVRHGWDRRQDTLWNQGATTPETGTNSAGDRCQYARMLWTYYRDEYNAIFTDTPLPAALDPMHPEPFPMTCRPKANAQAPDGNWEKMTRDGRDAISRVMANQGKAVAAYESKLISRNAPFDRFAAGDNGAISDRAKSGLRLFIGKASCIDCHSGPFFTDQQSHNLGVPQMGPNVPLRDLGEFDGIPQLQRNSFTSSGAFSDRPEHGAWIKDLKAEESDKGKFRTQTLRNLTQTAPYMHTGGLPSLRSVVEFYNQGGGSHGFAGTKDPKMRPLMLTEREIDDLVAFLETLTGEEIPAQLRAPPQ